MGTCWGQSAGLRPLEQVTIPPPDVAVGMVGMTEDFTFKGMTHDLSSSVVVKWARCWFTGDGCPVAKPARVDHFRKDDEG